MTRASTGTASVLFVVVGCTGSQIIPVLFFSLRLRWHSLLLVATYSLEALELPVQRKNFMNGGKFNSGIIGGLSPQYAAWPRGANFLQKT